MPRKQKNVASDNVQDFMAAWKSIREAIYAEANANGMSSGAFRDILSFAAEKSPIVSTYLKDILTFVAMSDLIDCEGNIESPVEVATSALARANIIAGLLRSPPLVMPTFKADVLQVEPTAGVKEVVMRMRKYSYSQIPVVTQGGVLTDLLTTDTISRWLADCMGDDRKFAKLRDAALTEVLACAEEFPDNARPFDVIGPKDTCCMVLGRFEKAVRTKCRLDALIVTADGTRKGKIVGIVTGWDIPLAVSLTSVNRLLEESAGRKKDLKRLAFIREGATYRMFFQGEQMTVKNTAGARYLCEFLHNPRKDFRSIEIIHRLAGKNYGQRTNGPEEQNSGKKVGQSYNDPSIEETVKRYRNELIECAEEIGKLKRDGGDGNKARISELCEEGERLRDEISRLTDKDGKPRTFKTTDDKGETIRRAVNRCLDELENNPTAEAVKMRTIVHMTFGSICRYDPPPDTEWE